MKMTAPSSLQIVSTYMGQLSTTIGITGVASVVYSYGDNMADERFGTASAVLFRLMSLCVLGYGVTMGILATSQCRTLLAHTDDDGLPPQYVSSVKWWPVLGYVYISFLCVFFTLFAAVKTVQHAKNVVGVLQRKLGRQTAQVVALSAANQATIEEHL